MPALAAEEATVIRYISTRDKTKTAVSFEDALLRGLAPDGGLYSPTSVPELEPDQWRACTSFADLGVVVLNAWLQNEIEPDALEVIVKDALTFEVPLVGLEENLWVLELFHGPTLSFKDVGARTMARLMQYFLARRGERRIILVATSGDTGSAVADGFAGMDNIEVVLLYPKGKVSDVQEQQLIVRRDNVRSFAVSGDFDDCQRLVKAAFVDEDLSHLPLSSANSINIGRLLPQTLYYLWALTKSTGQDDHRLPLFCVPSGNLGNLTGGVLAGLSTGQDLRFIAAHNANRFFPDYLEGESEAFAFSKTIPTVSNAMDVGSPSNFERLHSLVAQTELRQQLWGTSVSDDVTLRRLRQTYEAYGYVACPHTAVGLEGVARYREQTGDLEAAIVLATAHPAKFPDAVATTLEIKPPAEVALETLKDRERNVEDLEPTLEALKTKLA